MWKNLKSLREEKGLNQEEFGATVGVKKTTYQGYESGAREPDAQFWIDVSDRYMVTTDYLLDQVSDPHGTKYGGATKLDASYNALDEHGRRLVDLVVDAELERMAATPAPVIEFPRPMIQHFIVPAAAGYASPIDGEDYEMIPLPDGAPENADFCITVSGNSMEPYLYDRDLAYVKRGAPLQEYDVGVFSVNGETLIKRWYVDRSGVLHLRSINPAASGSNRTIPRSSQDRVVCYGKVINEKKPPRGET